MLIYFFSLATASAEPWSLSETDILKTLDRRALEMRIYSATGTTGGGEVLLSTSEGLIQLDIVSKAATVLAREPVMSAAWDASSGRRVAVGPRGIWREDLGWFYPAGYDRPAAGSADESGMQCEPYEGGVLATTGNDLWLLKSDQVTNLLSDTPGLFGRPGVEGGEAAVIGFWSLHRVSLSSPYATRLADIPLPAEARADVALGAAYVGRSLVAVFRRTGVYILSPLDRRFPPALAAPDPDAAHSERGFPEGWTDYSSEGGGIHVMNSSAQLYQLSVGQPLRRISRWPDLAEPYRFCLLPGGRAVLYPTRGNHVLLADPSQASAPTKLNFVRTRTGELLVRAGLAAPLISDRGVWVLFQSAATWGGLVAGVVAACVWALMFGFPGLYRMHPQSEAYHERLTKFQRDQAMLLHSFRRTEQELGRMKPAPDAAHMADETMRAQIEERQHVLAENETQLLADLRRLAAATRVEAERIRSERFASPAGEALMGRFLRTQAHGWERQFLRLAREIESALGAPAGGRRE